VRNGDARVDALSELWQSIAAEADRKKIARVAFGRIWERRNLRRIDALRRVSRGPVCRF